MPIGLGQKQQDRRRRVLREDRMTDETAAEGGRRRSRRRSPHRYGPGARRHHQPALLELLPRRWPTLLATFSLAALVIGTLLVAVWGATGSGPMAGAQLWQSPDATEFLSRAVNWLASVAMLGAAVVAFQIYLLRKHRRDDYQGHYLAWLWAASFAVLTASDLGTGWGAWTLLLVAAQVGLPDWAVTLAMLAPTLAIAIRMGFEVRESRTSLVILSTTSLTTLSGLIAMRLVSDPISLARVTSVTLLGGGLGMCLLTLLHLRFVVSQVYDRTAAGSEEALEEGAEPQPVQAKAPQVASDSSTPSRIAPEIAAKSSSAPAAPAPAVSAPSISGREPARSTPSPLGDRIAAAASRVAEPVDQDAEESEDDEDFDDAKRGGLSKAQRRKLAKQERRRQRDAA